MKRRNFLQNLTALGIGAAIVKPTIAEEIKPIPKLPPDFNLERFKKGYKEANSKVVFEIEGRNLAGVLYTEGKFILTYNRKILARGSLFSYKMNRDYIETGVDSYEYRNFVAGRRTYSFSFVIAKKDKELLIQYASKEIEFEMVTHTPDILITKGKGDILNFSINNPSSAQIIEITTNQIQMLEGFKKQ